MSAAIVLFVSQSVTFMNIALSSIVSFMLPRIID